jgi:hypothetical protein
LLGDERHVGIVHTQTARAQTVDHPPQQEAAVDPGIGGVRVREMASDVAQPGRAQ